MNNGTYQTQQITFTGTPQQRLATSNKDRRLVNCYIETLRSGDGQDSRKSLVQRAGLKYQNSNTPGVGRGIYYYKNNVYWVIGNQLYRSGAAYQTLSTSTGPIGFVEYAGLLPYLIILDGVSGWAINDAFVITQITDADFPTPHCTQAAYLDGYLLIAKSGTADIYNCDLDDPFVWQAGNFITAEMYPDNLVGVIRQNNYVVGVGEHTLEYFYNTGAFPGTPLGRNQAAFHQIGCCAPKTIVQSEEQVMFVGQTASGGRTVWVLDGFKPTEIASDIVRRSLDEEDATGGLPTTNISSAYAFCIRNKGHRFYVIQLTSKTWVFDFDEREWHEWADYTGATKFPCDVSTDHPVGRAFLLDRSNGIVYSLFNTLSSDATGAATTANITSIATTAKFDFGTMALKFMHRFSFVCDVPNGSNSTSINLEWSDDDYQTWSTPRVVPISDTMPSIKQLGSFRRRAFRITYSQAYPLRLDGAEIDLNMGNTL